MFGTARHFGRSGCAGLSETGLPGFESTTWQGLVVPVGTPRSVVTRLHAESVRVLQSDDVRSRLVASGTRPVGSTPEAFAAYIKAETAKWGKLIRSIGLKLD